MFKRKIFKDFLNKKKYIYISIAVLFTLSLLVWLVIYFSIPKKEKISLLNAIPCNASLIFEIRQPKDLWNELAVNSILWNDLAKMEPFSVINKEIRFLDSIFNKSSYIRDFFAADNAVCVSFHILPNNDIGFLFLTDLSNSCSKSDVNKFIKQSISPKITVSKRDFNGFDIVEVNTVNKKKLYYAFIKSVFVCSFQPCIVESAIKHELSGNAKVPNSDFKEVANTAGKRVKANIYINFKYFPFLLSKILTSEYPEILSGFAGWSALDIGLKKEAITFNGFCNTSDTTKDFLNIFKRQTAPEMEMLDIIPSSTATFLYYGFSDFNAWFRAYKNYLYNNGSLDKYREKISSINTKNNSDIEKNITTWLGKEMALVITENSDSGKTSNIFAIFKADNIDNAISMLASQSEVQIQKATKQKTNIKKDKKQKPKKGKTKEKIKENKPKPEATPQKIEITNNKIYKYKIPGAIPALFGELFQDVQGTYYCIIEDYIVFGNSSKSLQSFLRYYTEEKILRDNNNYITFSKNISNESNIYLFCNIKKSVELLAKYSNSEIGSYIRNNTSLIKNFQMFACQIKTNGSLFYNNICLNSNNAQSEESESLWIAEIDSTILFKPQIITDDNKSKKIIAFDNASYMYMFDNDGSLIWKTALIEKPLSPAYIVDYYNNGKKEFMFNTSSYIYCIDKNGQNIEKFPVKLKEAATAPMTVADYAEDKDYRLIIPCGNKIYNFLKNGSINSGWNIVNTTKEVCSMVNLLKLNGTTYFVANDKDGYIYIFDRKGNEKNKTSIRVSSNAAFYLSKQTNNQKESIITTDKTGNMIFISSTGNIEKKYVSSFSTSHYFLCEDINNDKLKEYIFIDKNILSIYSVNMKQICSYTFPTEISNMPELTEINNKTKYISVISKKAKKIYLLKPDCTIYDGFPINGTTPFVIESLNNDSYLNLIVGEDSRIYNYSFE